MPPVGQFMYYSKLLFLLPIDTNRIEARRAGRMILTKFVINPFTRTVNTITLSGFTILSAGSGKKIFNSKKNE